MQYCNYPRVVISGLSGDSGKTVVSCGLLACFMERGMNVVGFKKGPDYIDAAWLGLSCGKAVRNLDTYIMGHEKAKQSFLKNACIDGINIVEGNRGLFDGVNLEGTHSTYELARTLQSPVIVVLDVSKVTRTAAAFILGCKNLDAENIIKGVILNQVANKRHENLVRNAVEDLTGIPVVGAIPKLPDNLILPSRYFGLITPSEFKKNSTLLHELESIIQDGIDLNRILDIANAAPKIFVEIQENKKEIKNKPGDLKIGYFKDKAFSFYYPENLEMLIMNGAELIPISSTHNTYFDYLDALYIGGGFPEMNLNYISMNQKLITSIKQMAEEGLPIYAECGGLMYLAEKILWMEKEYSLSGILPIVINMHDKPQGHGYSEMVVDSENPFYEIGTVIKGHEFHYSKICNYDVNIKSCMSVKRGTGCFNERDGLVYKNVFASYLHVHALATPEWGAGMIRCARNYKELKSSRTVAIN